MLIKLVRWSESVRLSQRRISLGRSGALSLERWQVLAYVVPVLLSALLRVGH